MRRLTKNIDRATSIRPGIGWFFRLRGEESAALNAEELHNWERFAANADERREFIETKELWQVVHELGGPKSPTAAELKSDDYDGSLSVREWMARRVERLGKRHLFRPHRMLVLIAAGLLAVAVGMTLYVEYRALPWQKHEARAFATPVAQQREVRLADGSVVTLGARSEIQTRITALEREVILDRGEAWFNVAHDTSRPFRVLAGSGVITAVGTQFNVRRDRGREVDRVTVTVGEGIINVSPQVSRLSPTDTAPTSWQSARLIMGQELSYEGHRERSPIRSVDIEAAGAWKEGRLEYIHQPLEAVVASVNRYSTKPIVLADARVEGIDFSGTVFEGQVDDWIRALESAFPIEVSENEERILIEMR